MSTTVDLTEILAARDLQSGVVKETPVESCRYLSEILGRPVLLKFEHLQHTGSFKVRGAYVRLARLSEEQKRTGVVAASAGNHAQGVAYAAALLGISTVVYMPEDAALPKIAATRGYGAEVRLAGATLDEAIGHAVAEAETSGREFIHPFDHADIVNGQGTLGVELLEQVPDVGTVVIPTGGGGLIAGAATAIHASRPDVRIVGVQAEGAAAYPASLAAGRPVRLESMSTMADGIAVGLPGELPLALVAEHVERMCTVSEEALSRALLVLVERAKQVVEPSGAAGVAALMEGVLGDLDERPVVVVLSGGNVDPLVLQRIIRHGLASAGRYLQVRVRISDRPGGLAAFLVDIAATGASVLSIAHVRTAVDLALDEVEIDVELETKGPDHCAAVLERVRAHGHRVMAR
ncbi:threonine dehydratase [Beutenbergia cavernae DSM 12333]|uniref:threonine ammonia-lyase n=1 Tax=Beutenbergia cavernae (strain ATCC BAA-8 / DSM 12333 / CCUG 43141 / JCM 11478 / NBRC 16432 / NCIMB 13614 / HKI 0122) TaxID=471853 RepID=C5C0E9_BEUC1|nr:threonine ammonia-lyase [Beutenbergia cavernae]ACQ79335.1 threonine dehydratase [Beutenbergia cavernae DSM 12333]